MCLIFIVLGDCGDVLTTKISRNMFLVITHMTSCMWYNHMSLIMWPAMDATYSHAAVMSLFQYGFHCVLVAMSSECINY